MGQAVVHGAQAMCSMGTSPGGVKVSSQQTVSAGGATMATIQDAGTLNIGPFGMCTSMTNPAVASATAAAQGVLQPQPCTPVPAGPWGPGKTNIIICGNPCLDSDSQMACSYAGSIKIVSPGQTTVNV